MKKLFLVIFILFLSFFGISSAFCQGKEFVSLVNGIFDEKEGMVILSWEPVENPLASYKIYRIKEPLRGNRFIPLNAEMVKVLDYQSRQTSDIPARSGEYYYFISVVLGNEENLALVADQNYTVKPVVFFQNAPQPADLKGKLMYQSSEILLKWELPPQSEEPAKEFKIYRFKDSITRENLSQADLLAQIPGTQNLYFDKIPGTGKYYYAVTSVSQRKYENTKIAAGDNSMVKPVTVAALDAKKLPEFYIEFPVSLQFILSYEDDWIQAPETLNLQVLPLREMYVPERQKSGETKELKETKEDVSQEIPIEQGLTPELVKKEIESVNALFSDYYRGRQFEEFIQAAEKREKSLKSGYALKKILFFKAVSYYYLNRPAQALLILKDLKQDQRFLKYNEKKIKLLENKIQEKS